MLLIILLWVIGCIALTVLNAKFWQLFPDTEQEQHNQNKSRK